MRNVFVSMGIVLLGMMAPAFAQTPAAMSLDDAFDTLKSYTIGGDFTANQRIIDEVIAAKDNPDAKAAIAARLAAALKGASYDTQKFLCFWLYNVGTEKEVPALAPLLNDEKTATIARYALDAIPGAAVEQVLVDHLKSATPLVRIGIFESLAKRGNPAHVAVIAPYLTDTPLIVARAAANALGTMGTPEALAVLDKNLSTKNNRFRPAIVDAALKAATACAEKGSAAAAGPVLERLLSRVEDKPVRIAAFCGIIASLSPEAAGSRLVDTLSGRDPLLVATATALARRMPGEAITMALAFDLPTASPEQQVVLLAILADRGDTKAYGNVFPLLNSPEIAVRLAAIDAVGRLGDDSAAKPLLEHLSAPEEGERNAARAALVVLRGDLIDGMIANALMTTPDGALKQLLMGIIAERGAVIATDPLLELAQAEDPALRHEAVKTLGAIVAVDKLPALLALIKSKDPADQEAVEMAAVTALRRLGGESGAVTKINEAFRKHHKADQRALLVRVLGRSGDSAALPALRDAAGSHNEKIRRAAIEALGNWPTPAPLEDLHALALKKKVKPEDRIAALDGMLKLLRQTAQSPTLETIPMYREALALATTPEETRKVLSGIGEVKDTAVLDLLRPYLDSGECRAEAAVAAEKVLRRFYKLSASVNNVMASEAADNDIDSLWSTDQPQEPGQWLQIDLGVRARIGGLMLDTSRSANNYPRGYAVYVSDDPNGAGAPVSSGATDQPVVRIEFTPTEGRYVRIVQTGSASAPWSVHEMKALVK